MEALVAKADRPGSGNTKRIASTQQSRMSIDGWRQLGDMLPHPLQDQCTQRANGRLVADQQIAIGLRSATNRLIERGMAGDVQSAKMYRESRKIADIIRQIIYTNQSSVAFEPRCARIGKHPPSERAIRP